MHEEDTATGSAEEAAFMKELMGEEAPSASGAPPGSAAPPAASAPVDDDAMLKELEKELMK